MTAKQVTDLQESLAELVLAFTDAEALGSAFKIAQWTPKEAIEILTDLARDNDQKGNVRVASIKLLSLIGKQALEAQGYLASLSQKRLGMDAQGNPTVTTARMAGILQSRKRFDLLPHSEEPTNESKPDEPLETGGDSDTLGATGGDTPPAGPLLGAHRPPEEKAPDSEEDSPTSSGEPPDPTRRGPSSGDDD